MFVYDGFGADNRRYTLQTMRRVFGYAASLDTAESRPKEGYAYTKYSIRTNRRNAVLLTVPSMFAIANASKREVFGETFNRMSVDSEGPHHGAAYSGELYHTAQVAAHADGAFVPHSAHL